MSASPVWTRISERGSSWGLRFAVGCYRTFGRPVTLVIVHIIISYFFVTDGRGRRASLAYLRRVHDLTASSGTRPGLWQSFLHYRMFALSIFDRVAFWLGRDDQFELDFNGEELFSRVIDEGRGAIIVGSHLGSFDSMRLLAHRAGVAVNVLMFTDHAPLLNSIFRELSPDSEMNVIRADPSSMKTAFEVRSRIERGELVAILADRIEPGDRGSVHRTRFMGSQADFPTGAFLLATLFGCPVIHMVGLRRGANRYEITAELLCEAETVPRRNRRVHIEALVERYAQRLEHFCLDSPYQWFNYYDFWSDERAGEEAIEEAA
jgi:predicted LPLAT superfamily acyltransferase